MARALSNPVYLTSPEKGVDGRGIIVLARDPLPSDGRIGDLCYQELTKKLYGPKNASGWPDKGLIRGAHGWYPLERIVADGTRRVVEIFDWAGGEGAKPETGYKTASGELSETIAEAVDTRGPQGPEMLINALAAGADDLSYDSLTATAEDDTDNEHQPLKRVLGAGGLLQFDSVANAAALSVPASVKAVQINGATAAEGGAGHIRRRVSAEPSAGPKHRSQDRFTAEGATDSVNGGWWGLEQPTSFTPGVTNSIARPWYAKAREQGWSPDDFGAVGDNIVTTIMQRWMDSAEPLLFMPRSYRIDEGLLLSAAGQRISGKRSAVLSYVAPGARPYAAIVVHQDAVGAEIRGISIDHQGTQFSRFGPDSTGKAWSTDVFGTSLLVMADDVSIEGITVRNGWDNCIGIGSYDVDTWDQNNYAPKRVRISNVLTVNGGCGPHDWGLAPGGFYNQGAGIDLLTCDGALVTGCVDFGSRAGFMSDVGGAASGLFANCIANGNPGTPGEWDPDYTTTFFGFGFYLGSIHTGVSNCISKYAARAALVVSKFASGPQINGFQAISPGKEGLYLSSVGRTGLGAQRGIPLELHNINIEDPGAGIADYGGTSAVVAQAEADTGTLDIRIHGLKVRGSNHQYGIDLKASGTTGVQMHVIGYDVQAGTLGEVFQGTNCKLSTIDVVKGVDTTGVRVRKDQNSAELLSTIANFSTGTGAVAAQGFSNGTVQMEYGIAGANYGGYGILTANAAYMLHPGSGGIALMATHANGAVRIAAGGASELARIDASGLYLVGGTWNTPHLAMGAQHLWFDTAGRLRVKNGAPTSATDGTVVGTQA